MAADPSLSLRVQTPDVGSAFSNALLNISRLDQIKQQREEAPQRARILEAQTAAAEAAVPTAQQTFDLAQQNKIKSLALASSQIIPDLQSGNVESVVSKLQGRAMALKEAGIDNSDTLEAIQLAQTNPQGLLAASQQAVQLASQLPQEGASARAFAPTTDPETGEVSSVVFDPQEKQFTSTVIPGAKQQTPREKSELAVQTAAKTERAKLKEKRASAIKTEIADRNRNAARSARTTRRALTLAQTASQGLTGASKLSLSRLIPGIDASDEAALDASLKELALEQLQQFKGPTTDFEFGVTQSIAGALGQSKEANVARIKSLDRNTWFNQREQEQLTKHLDSGGDPDTFRFNFGEPIKTKKGVFTLQDIQDTAVQNTLTIEETIKRLNK